MSEPGGTPAPTVRGLALTALIAGLWGLLALLRPTVTFHLAPALVALALPAAHWIWSPKTSAAAAVLSPVAGGVIAAVTTLALGAAGLLEGPVLFGGDAVGEGLIVIAVVSATAVIAGVARVALTGAGGSDRKGCVRRP